MITTEKKEYFFEIKPKSSLLPSFKELSDYKELFYYFTWRDIKVKYKQTFFGILWAIIQPMLMMLILNFYLGPSLSADTEGIAYPVFVFSGLILWLVFSTGIINAGASMITNAQIIKKIYFPRLIVPSSSILVGVFDFGIAFVMFIILLIYFGQPVNIGKALWMWPCGVLVTVLCTFGLGCMLAALNIKYRDFRYALPFIVQMLLFVTPVIYPISILKQSWLQYLTALNPMYAALAFFRLPMSSTTPDLSLMALSLSSAILTVIIGLIYFKRTEMYFADLV